MESESWSKRMLAFEELSNYVGSKAGKLSGFHVFEKIINLHFTSLTDKHFKVQLVAIESTQKLLGTFGETIEPYIGEIIPRLMQNMSSHND